MPLLPRAFILVALFPFTLIAQGSHWNRFAEFGVIADTLMMRWPSLVTRGDTSVIAANVFPATATEFSGEKRLAIVQVPGGMLPIPDGAFVFVHPHLVTDSEGTLHLVWAEPGTAGESTSSFMAPRVSLWHAAFRAGRWSTPNKVLSGRSLGWFGTGRPVIPGTAGRIHIVVTAVLDDGQIVITYLRLAENGSVEQESHWSGGAYASITALRGDSVLVSFSTADALTPRRGSSTFVRVSGDGGRSWAEPAVITRSAERPGSPPMVEQFGSEFHALWAEQRPGGSVVRGFIAASPLEPWREIESPLPLRGLPIRIVGAAARCGQYAVLFETMVGTPPDARIRIVEVYAHGNRLFGQEVFPQGETAGNVAIAPAGDSLRIVLSLVRRGEKTTVNATSNGRACGTT